MAQVPSLQIFPGDPRGQPKLGGNVDKQPALARDPDRPPAQQTLGLGAPRLFVKVRPAAASATRFDPRFAIIAAIKDGTTPAVSLVAVVFRVLENHGNF
ncbi:hypothetical protein PpBr36_02035 [Pyricularia pennisetigena]|uniref:hypothetical protein n=1 Tax=Pyricularia pennisetigena TaxID=1578925 RepID=UPI0011506007|nr:hypothetical protein PpBr36_02035 [Pyricularia pennisetigena]TLS29145.1 hypothetical protein PpBr36_02035 [Pyricularia pennisetigena]